MDLNDQGRLDRGQSLYKSGYLVSNQQRTKALRFAFVHFKYIDNCNECNCKAVNILNVNKINISEFLGKAEEKALCENISSENFFTSILNYILQNTTPS